MSIKNKIVLNLTLFTTVPIVVISVLIYGYVYQKATDELRQNVRQSVNQTAASLNHEMMNYIQKSNYMLSSNYYFPLLDDLSFNNDVLLITDFQKMFAANFLPLDDQQFLIYLDHYDGYRGKFINDFSALENQSVPGRLLDAPSAEILWRRGPRTINGKTYITFYRNASLQLANYKGILEVNIPYRHLEPYLSQMNGLPRETVLIHSKNGQTVYTHNAERGEPNSDHRYTVAVNQPLIDGSELIIAVPRQIVFRQTTTFLYYMAAIVPMLICGIMYASAVTSRNIMKSFNRFIADIRRNDDLLANFETIESIEIEPEDEVALIKRRFVNILKSMNGLHTDLMNVKSEKNNLEIELLQSRINPHLLYNSLSVIKWSALKNNDDKTVAIIDAMTRYYRIALNKGDSIVPVSKELEMIGLYMKIISFAHSSPYRLALNITEEAMGRSMLKHLLQPIVENAVMHGLNGKGEEAKITINGYTEAGYLVFEVIDNGYGMEETTVRQLVSLSYSASYGGYGIKNVVKRLQFYNGDEGGFDMSSAIGQGTKVTIKMRLPG